MQAHLNGETTPSILSRKIFKTIHMEESQGGVPAFAINTRSPAIMGRSLAHGGSNGRNSADHLILLDRGVGVFYAMTAAPPENIPTGWLALTTMLATALPDRWPRPASHPPKPDANGVVEGEALQIIGLTAGSVEIQDFADLSKKFQLWWRGERKVTGSCFGSKCRTGALCRGRGVLPRCRLRRRDIATGLHPETIVIPGCTTRLGPHRSRP